MYHLTRFISNFTIKYLVEKHTDVIELLAGTLIMMAYFHRFIFNNFSSGKGQILENVFSTFGVLFNVQFSQ